MQKVPLSTFIPSLSLSLLFFVFCFFSLSLFLSLFVSFSRAFRAACTMSTDRPSQGFILIPFPPCPGEGIGFNFRPAGNSIRNGAL